MRNSGSKVALCNFHH